MTDAPISEAALYRPVKAYLEAQGFEVKGEVCGCDLVAIRAEELPIVDIGKLKLLQLVVMKAGYLPCRRFTKETA